MYHSGMRQEVNNEQLAGKTITVQLGVPNFF